MRPLGIQRHNYFANYVRIVPKVTATDYQARNQWRCQIHHFSHTNETMKTQGKSEPGLKEGGK